MIAKLIHTHICKFFFFLIHTHTHTHKTKQHVEALTYNATYLHISFTRHNQFHLMTVYFYSQAHRNKHMHLNILTNPTTQPLDSPIVPSNMNVLFVGIAHEHKSHVVSPSLSTGSSTRNGGRGGGGTKRPFHKPLSEASNANGEPNKSSSSSNISKDTSRKLLKSSAELATRFSILGGRKVGYVTATPRLLIPLLLLLMVLLLLVSMVALVLVLAFVTASMAGRKLVSNLVARRLGSTAAEWEAAAAVRSTFTPTLLPPPVSVSTSGCSRRSKVSGC